MQIPVHKDNLLPRGKEVGKYIHIRHRCDIHPPQVEIWRKFFLNWYVHEETRVFKTPKIKRK